MAIAAKGPLTGDVVAHHLRRRRSDVKGMLFQAALLFALLLSLLILLVLLVDVLRGGIGVFQERGADFLGGRLTVVSPTTAGVGQGIVGSLTLLVFVVLLAFPVGIAAAVYLEEYASDTRFNRFIDVNIRNLAGVPSIVYGLLGLVIFVQVLAPLTGGKTAMAGGLTLAVLVLPIIIITSMEALRAVPDSIREAGFGVGATRWEVIRSHVLPAAAPGILTGTVLSISRAVGETAPLLVVGATTGLLATGGSSFFDSFREGYTALPVVVFRWTSLPNEDFRALTAAAIIVLLLMTLSANAIAIVLRNRYERKW
jgi:phosphate transport system permease protein